MYIDSTVSSNENVIRLINEVNGTEFKSEQLIALNPVAFTPVDPEINNTSVTIRAIPGTGFSGSVPMKYRRADLMEVTYIPVRSFDVFPGMTAELLTPLAEMSLGLPPGNIDVMRFRPNAPLVTIKAKPDSLLVTGEYDFVLEWH